MKNKFKLSDAYEFGWPGIKARAFNSKEDFSRASAAMFDVTGSHGRVMNKVSDRIYLVLEGSGEFDIEGKKIPVETSDVVIVPRETEYDYSGEMKLFLVHSPAYDPDTDIDIDGVQTG